MKKMLSAWLFITILYVFSCTRNQTSPGVSKPEVTNQESTVQTIPLVSGGPTCSCGGIYSGTHSYTNGSGLYIYPNQPLNFSCLSVGDTVTIDCQPDDVPNTFTIYDGNGDVVAYTPWIGNATWPGPWGRSLSTLQANNYISFVYTGAGSYYMQVATSTSSTPPAATSDAWNANITCSHGMPNCKGCVPIDTSSICLCPSAIYSGTYSYNGTDQFHIYAPIQLNLTCSPSAVGDSVIIDCMPDDVPNTFTVLDQNGNVVAYTPWIGNATWAGPWGSSLSTLQANNYIGFKVAANTTYYLSIATVVQGTPTQASSDAWNVSLTCKAP